jgi:hypothetical protein
MAVEAVGKAAALLACQRKKERILQEKVERGSIAAEKLTNFLPFFLLVFPDIIPAET